MPDSVNERLADAATRHQVWLIRFGGSRAKQLIKLLDEAAADLEKRLAGKIAALPAAAGDPLQQAGVRRLQAILSAIKAQNADLAIALERELRADLVELAHAEVDIADRRLNESVGVDLKNFRPAPEILRAIVDGPLVRAKTLKQWFRKLTNDRTARLESAVRVGLISGDTTDQIIRRFRDAEDISRRSAEALVRTNVNHVANAARDSLYQANADVIKGVRWVSTLDGRTSAICRARDGEIYPLDSGPRPPAHPNCRSTVAPVTRSWRELGAKNLTPGRGSRKFDTLLRDRLKAQGMSDEQLAHVRANVRSSLDGGVPAKTTYGDWLKKQPVGFQNDVLGPSKAKLFRDGKLPIDRFVDRVTGKPFTLDELKARESAAWAKAGLDSAA